VPDRQTGKKKAAAASGMRFGGKTSQRGSVNIMREADLHDRARKEATSKGQITTVAISYARAASISGKGCRRHHLPDRAQRYGLLASRPVGAAYRCKAPTEAFFAPRPSGMAALAAQHRRAVAQPRSCARRMNRPPSVRLNNQRNGWPGVASGASGFGQSPRDGPIR